MMYGRERINTCTGNTSEKGIMDAFTGTAKRVLFLNPVKGDKYKAGCVNMGLTLLGGILSERGHEVKVVDYAFLSLIKDRIRVPDVEEFIREFKPDVVGITVFTYLYDDVNRMIGTVSRCSNAPIILGGPHFRVFPEDFRDDARVSYIVSGEAEKVIVNLVESAKCESRPVFIEAPLPSADDIPAVNLDIVHGNQYLDLYIIQLSRGCPYSCVFCNVRNIAGQKIRKRSVETCLDQIIDAQSRYPNIKTINITDDCPTFDMDRFKKFLIMFKERNLGCNLHIDNVRANLIDEELIQLYVAAGGINICLGIESGHPEIFKNIKKGETIEEIVEATRLVKKYGLILGGCFVIGLPGDNLEKFKHTLKFAKSLDLDYAFWNMMFPWPWTEVNKWYRDNGEIGEMRNVSSLIDQDVNFDEPPATTPDFTREDRVKAWLMANMQMRAYFRPHSIGKLLLLSVRYGLYMSFAKYFIRSFLPCLVVFTKRGLLRFAAGVASPLLKKSSLFNYFEKICNIPHFALIRAVESRLVSNHMDKDKGPFLDLGCGDGTFGKSLDLKDVYGIDLNEDVIKAVANDGYYRKVLLASASEIPFQEGFFGTVFSNCALEHMDDIDRVFEEVRRVLVEKGEFVFTVPLANFMDVLKSDTLLNKLDLNTNEVINEYNRIHHHVNILDVETWKRKIESAGFVLSSRRYYLPEPFGSFVVRMDMLYTIRTVEARKTLKEEEKKYFSSSNLSFRVSMWRHAGNPRATGNGTHALFKAVKA
jgi:anaerobic magnesium-protoporphyrin IX monomethyl ester cyclase